MTDDSDTITLKVRPAWREVAVMRGVPVEWLVAQYMGLTCSKVLRRKKAKQSKLLSIYEELVAGGIDHGKN